MQERSFWSQLFDFSFSSFVTLKVIKVLYGLWIVIGVIAAMSTLTGGLGMMGIMHFGYGWSTGAFLLSLIWAVIFFFLWVIGGRIWMETIIVLFRIAENTSALVEAGRGGARGADGSPGESNAG
ncbi:MAG: DUF4282 domain-containing protein [Desulfotomaculales bacterium]